ncbi:MAG: hypothetical protein WCK33_03535 [Phycisphaerae bacterium]|jgi:hypothetical protein
MNADAANDAPLSSDHIRQLAMGALRAKKIRRTATFASISGWSMVILGGMSLLWGLLGDMPSIVMGAALGGLGINELAGANLLRRLDERGPKRLANNQLMLGGLMVAYAIWASYVAWADGGSSPLASAGMVDPTVLVTLQLVTYGLVGGIGAMVGFFTALYYRSRGRLLREMLSETSPWVVETMRVAA